MDREPFLDEGGKQRWCTTTKTVICTILLICGVTFIIVGTGILVGTIEFEHTKQPVTLLHQDGVTSGETYQVQIKADTQDVCTSDMCSSSSCSKVTLTFDPTSANITGELGVSCCTLNLSNTNSITATLFDHPVKQSYSNWSFHLHRGSTLNITLCAEAAGPSCHNEAPYYFVIIRGKQNFTSWSRGDEIPEYTVNITNPYLRTVADCRSQFATLPLYTYSENGDYYHVIRNSAELGCDIKVFASAIFKRKQYNNDRIITCNVGIDKPSCNRDTEFAEYVTVYTDTNTEWTEQVGFSLTCDSIVNRDMRVKVVLEFTVPAAVAVLLIGSVVVVSTCIYKYRRRVDKRIRHNHIEDVPEEALGEAGEAPQPLIAGEPVRLQQAGEIPKHQPRPECVPDHVP